jgi:hypothetical protein
MLRASKILLFNHIKRRKHNNKLLCFVVLFRPKINATTFYVNDNSNTGDIYTAAIGNDSNYGTCASSVCQTTINWL